MLSWLANDVPGPASDRDADQDVLAGIDPDAPETPAPVFAVKAFRHAIFGTPKADEQGLPRTRPQQQKSASQLRANRHSIDEPRRQPEGPASRTSQKGQKSTSRPFSLGLSPARRPGILLTPGTGGNRGKTVSFGNPSKAADDLGVRDLPKDSADTFPRSKSCQRTTGHGQSLEFTEKLRHFGVGPGTKPTDDVSKVAQDATEDTTVDMCAPRSTSGRYWKAEFDSYSSKSELEMRKLLKKEQVAKKYAKLKDIDAVKLQEELRVERKKAARLEKQVEDLTARLAEVSIEDGKRKTSGPTEGRARRQTTTPRTEHEAPPKGHQVPLAQSSRYRQHQEVTTLPRETRSSGATDLTRSHRSQRVPPTKAMVQDHESSDIWAQAANNNNGADKSTDESTHSKTPALLPAYSERNPLVSRDVNAGCSEAPSKSSRMSSMTQERREEALKRLDARKKKRGALGAG